MGKKKKDKNEESIEATELGDPHETMKKKNKSKSTFSKTVVSSSPDCLQVTNMGKGVSKEVANESYQVTEDGSKPKKKKKKKKENGELILEEEIVEKHEDSEVS